MSPAEVSRITDDKPVFEPPFTAQRIVDRRDRLDFLVIAPVRYDVDAFRRNLQRGYIDIVEYYDDSGKLVRREVRQK